MLKEGDRIPDFRVKDQDGNTVTQKDFEGKRIVLYFYPKDSTPGCTAEACNLRDNYGALRAAGYEIYGVSKDSIASHGRFMEKNSLPFTLLSDPSTEMLQAFGAWGEKKLYGKVSGMGRKETLRKGQHGNPPEDFHHCRRRHYRTYYRQCRHEKPHGADSGCAIILFSKNTATHDRI